ncbi:right-handed parallel beta-helix repeat-containing protein [Simiduia agarivorans]|uniref:right-handed parallel beta-helix repeat-containing protein n=1 Tax=Simiduia agarivorans TaxID=447471 RepID=UPI00028A8697|nr:right-handed parallel beta-helix repeat-containing protein [Simiduia agarivorans]
MNLLIKNVIVLFVALCSFLAAEVAYSEQYYVSKAGSDSNDGLSPSSAWLTIQHAAQNLVAGDTVYVDEGVYSEPDPVPPSTQWWGIRPKNSGTSDSPIVFKAVEGKSVVIDNNMQAPCFTIYGVEYVEIRGFELRNCQFAGVWIQSGSVSRNYGISVVGNHIHTIDGPSGTNVGGIRADRVGKAYIANNLIHDIRVGGDMAKENGAGVHSYRMWEVTIENNEIYNAANGIYYKYPDDESRGNTIIRKNYFHDTILDAIQLSNNDTAPGHHVDNVISQNIVYNCGGFYDDDTYQSSVQANGLKIFNNTVVNSGGIEVRGTKNVEIYNNIFYGVSTNIQKGLDLAQSPAFRTIYSSVIFTNPTKRYGPSIKYTDHNLAYPLFSVQAGLYYSAEEEVFQNLSAWRSALALKPYRGMDMDVQSNAESSSIEGDPKFYNVVGGNFRLMPDSPARGAGKNGSDLGAYPNRNDKIGIPDELAPCPPMTNADC